MCWRKKTQSFRNWTGLWSTSTKALHQWALCILVAIASDSKGFVCFFFGSLVPVEGLHKVISNKRRFSSIFQLPYVGLSKGKLVQLARWQIRFQGCEQCDLTEYHKLHLKSWGFCWWKVALQHQGRGEVFQVTWQWGICQKGLAKRWDCGVCPKCSAYEHRDAWHFWVGINGFGIKASLWPNRNYFHWSHWKTSQKKISWKSSSIPKTVALWKVALNILPLMCCLCQTSSYRSSSRESSAFMVHPPDFFHESIRQLLRKSNGYPLPAQDG